MKKRIISLLMTLCIVLSMVSVNAFAATSVVRYNVSKSAVSCNATAGSLPTSLSSLSAGSSYYFNLQVSSDLKIKTAKLYVKDVGASSYTNVHTETASNYMRYVYYKYTVGSSAGTLKYYWKLTYTDGTTKTTSATSITVTSSSVSSKISAFISDSRWKSGVSWGSSQTPKLSSYSSTGCCAYAADFAKYVHGASSPRGGTKYTSASDIATGDIIYVTPQHWMCILSRSGSTIKVAEGNYDSVVHIGTYTISGSKILTSSGSTYKTFSYGYHF